MQGTVGTVLVYLNCCKYNYSVCGGSHYCSQNQPGIYSSNLFVLFVTGLRLLLAITVITAYLILAMTIFKRKEADDFPLGQSTARDG